MNSKLLFLDVETTGLNPVKNSIIQIAGIIEIDGQVKESFDFNCRPIEKENEISPQAIKTHGISYGKMMEYNSPESAKLQLEKIFAKYIDKFDKADKFTVAGQNVNFDIQFLVEFWKRAGDNYLFSYIDSRGQIDILYIVRFLSHCGLINISDHKLETICNYFNIGIDSHDAMSDIEATRQIYHILKNNIKFIKIGV